MAGTYELPEEGTPNTTADPKIKTMLKGLNELLTAENKIQWYKPVSIATEQERESASFGTLTTPDEVKNVVLPENGLLAIGYVAVVKSSVGSAGRAAIFLGANQLKGAAEAGAPEAQEAKTTETKTTTLCSAGGGIANLTIGTSLVTTGQAFGAIVSGGPIGSNGGLCYVFAAPGTYNISVQYRATSGKVTAKERKLWCGVMGV